MERWEFDVMKEGEVKLKEAVTNVKAMAANLWVSVRQWSTFTELIL